MDIAELKLEIDRLSEAHQHYGACCDGEHFTAEAESAVEAIHKIWDRINLILGLPAEN